MVDKGLLLRDDTERSHIYRPAQARDHTLRHMVDDLLERAFGGSALDLLATTLSSRKLAAKEREELTRMLTQTKERKP